MKIKKLKGVFTSVFTTMDKYTESQFIVNTTLVDTTKQEGGLKEYQKVITVGSAVREVKPGDIVCINPKNYEVRKFSESSVKADIMENNVVRYNFNVIETTQGPLLHLQERDIAFIVEEFEDDKVIQM